MEEEPKIRCLVIKHDTAGLLLENAAESTMTLGEFRKFTSDLPEDTRLVLDKDSFIPYTYATMSTGEISEEWIL